MTERPSTPSPQAPPTSGGRRVTLVAMAVGAVLTIAGDIVQPHTGDGARSLVATVSAHPDQWLLGYSLQLVAAVPLMAGVVGLAARVRARGRRLTRVGAGVLATGVLGSAALAAAELMLIPVATGPHAAAVMMAHRMNQSAALLVVFALVLPGMFFGVPLLALGLARAGAQSWVLAGVAILATVVAFTASGTLFGTVALAVQMAALVMFAAGSTRRTTRVAVPDPGPIAA